MIVAVGNYEIFNDKELLEGYPTTTKSNMMDLWINY